MFKKLSKIVKKICILSNKLCLNSRKEKLREFLKIKLISLGKKYAKVDLPVFVLISGTTTISLFLKYNIFPKKINHHHHHHHLFLHSLNCSAGFST